MASTFGGSSAPRDDQFRKVLILVLVAVLFISAMGAAFMLLPMLSKEETAEVAPQKPLIMLSNPSDETPEEMVNIYVALRTLQSGEALAPDLFRVESVKKSKVPLGALTGLEQLAGYWVKDPIPPGVAVTLGMLSTVRPTSTLAQVIEEGHRAVTITVNEQTGVEGWARPGALVDVVLLAKDESKELIAKSIICGVKVLSLGRQTVSQMLVKAGEQGGGATNSGPVPSTVTLQVPNNEVNKLVLAQASGTLTLTLRNDKDPSSGCSSGTTGLVDVITGETGGPTTKETPKGPIVKVTAPDGSVKQFTFTSNGLKPVEEY